MAHSINGIGTTFYGERDYWPDGSFITTEWIIIVHIPILPLRSMRVLYDRTTPNFGVGLGSTAHFFVSAKTFPNWKQVLCTYLYLLLSPMTLVPMSILFGDMILPKDIRIEGTFALVIIALTVIVVVVWAFIPRVLRRRAFRRVGL